MIIIKQIITENSETLFIVLSLSLCSSIPFSILWFFLLTFALVFASIQSQSNFFISNYNNFSCEKKRLNCVLFILCMYAMILRLTFLRERERERTSKRALIKASLDIIVAYCSLLVVARKPVKELGLVSEEVQPSAIFSILGWRMGMGWGILQISKNIS